MTQGGHERAAFAAMHGPDLLYLVSDPWPSGKPMQRREFITLLGGAAAWPLAAGAQQAERMRRIGIIGDAAISGDHFRQGLRDLGYIEGRNVTIEYRSAERSDRLAAAATELARSRHRLPAVYPFRFFVAAGGLMSYGTDFVDQSRQAAGYVDRILRGAHAADLPVQAPTKYETVLNLRTAKALGLDVPSSLLVRADEVIE